MPSDYEIKISGNRQLDRRLERLFGAKAASQLNKHSRAAIRKAVKTYVQPDVLSAVPEDTGELRKSLKVKAVGRSRSRHGIQLTSGDNLFVGDTFYGGFIEFGTKIRSNAAGSNRGLIEEDSFLRRGLYTNTNTVRRMYLRELLGWLRSEEARQHG